MKMISQYMSNMLIGIITTLLCRLLKERKIHSKFIKKILTMLDQLNGANQQDQNMTIVAHISQIFQNIQGQASSYSVKQQEPLM